MNAELKNKLNGRQVVASISGGKDSAALSLWLHEQGIDHIRTFQDTGWEHPDTLAYLRGPLTEKIGPIIELRGELQMRDLILKKGMFPSRKIRFCTEELKIKPMQKFFKSDPRVMDADCVNAVGIRQEESAARADALEWEWSNTFDCEVWRPLVKWKLQDVIDIHARHNLPPNPLYLRGAERVGCWPCINSRKSEIRMLAEIDPARVAEIADIEAQVAGMAKVRWDRDREAWLANPPPEPVKWILDEDGFEDRISPRWDAWEKKRQRLFVRPFHGPNFFQDSAADDEGCYPSVPIAEVVDWSQTKRGGKQYEMFAGHGRDAGCVRWGLCEQPKTDGDDNDD